MEADPKSPNYSLYKAKTQSRKPTYVLRFDINRDPGIDFDQSDEDEEEDENEY